MSQKEMTRKTFVESLQRKHKQNVWVMLMIAGGFIVFPVVVATPFLLKLGMAICVMGSLLCARASKRMSSENVEEVMCEARRLQLLEMSILGVGVLLMVGTNVALAIALWVFYAGVKEEQQRVQLARVLA